MRLHDGTTVALKSGKYRVAVSGELRQRLDDLLGLGACRVMMSRPKLGAGGDKGNGWKGKGKRDE